jgi:hypothetical protein
MYMLRMLGWSDPLEIILILTLRRLQPSYNASPPSNRVEYLQMTKCPCTICIKIHLIALLKSSFILQPRYMVYNMHGGMQNASLCIFMMNDKSLTLTAAPTKGQLAD